MARLSAEQVSAFERDGYLLVKGVLPRDEVAALRTCVESLRRRVAGTPECASDPLYPKAWFFVGDALGKPELRDKDYVFLDPRVVDTIASLIGGPLVYFGDSSLQVGEATRGFHKDNVDRSDPSGPDWQGDYTVVRCGLYLQDHSRHSGGLKVRRGSHNFVSRHRGRAVNVGTEAGDLVVWSLRTSHSGNVVRMKGLPGVALHPRIEGALPAWLRVPEERERIAMFCSFGRPDRHVDRYIEYQRARKDMPPHWRLSGWSPGLVELARSRGVELRRPIAEYGRDLEPPA
jgi:hypothetical protein